MCKSCIDRRSIMLWYLIPFTIPFALVAVFILLGTWLAPTYWVYPPWWHHVLGGVAVMGITYLAEQWEKPIYQRHRNRHKEFYDDWKEKP